MNPAKSIGAHYAELGAALFAAQRHQEAVAALHKALEERPPDFNLADIYLTLGRAYIALGKSGDAIQAFSEAVYLDHDSFQKAAEEIVKIRNEMFVARGKEATLKRGFEWLTNFASGLLSRTQPALKRVASTLLEHDRFAEAELLLELILLSSPGDADSHEALGWVLLERGRHAESVASFNRAISLEEDRPYAYQGAATAYHRLGLWQNAHEALRRALELNPEEPAALLLHGVILRSLNDLEGSKQTLLRVTRLTPGSYKAHRELAATLFAKGEIAEAAGTLMEGAQLLLKERAYKEAEQLAEAAAGMDASSGAAHLILGRALIAQQRYAEAADVLKKAVGLNAGAEAYLQLARAHFFRKAFPEALECVEQALPGSPDRAEALGLKGMILHRSKRPEEALQSLRESLSLKREQPTVAAELGAVLEALKQPAEAREAYALAVALNAESRWAQGRLGLLLLDQGDFEAAAAALEAARKAPPSETEGFALGRQLETPAESVLFTKRGRALLALGRSEQALGAFEQAMVADPASAEASHQRAKTLNRLGRGKEAVTAYQSAIDLYAAQGQEEVSVLYAEMGEALRKLNRLQEAKSAFKQALALTEDNPWALARYGETLRALGKYEEALTCLERAVALDPGDNLAWSSLGITRADLGRYRSALVAFDRAIELDPRSAFDIAYKGFVLRLGRRYTPAIEALDRAIGLDGQTAWFWLEKGIAVRERGADGWEEALSFLETSVKLDPQSGYNRCHLAVCFYDLGRHEEALGTLEGALKIDPTLAWAYNLRALILEKMGKDAEAKVAHDQAVGRLEDPDAYFESSVNLRELGAYEHAVRDLRTTMELKPDHADVYNELAWLHTLNPHGDLEEATELAKRAIELSPGNGNFLDTLGWIYFKRGMPGEALPLLRKAVELLPEELEIYDRFTLCEQAVQAQAGSASGA